eukprot:Gb_38888 [translate_table: standard]
MIGTYGLALYVLLLVPYMCICVSANPLYTETQALLALKAGIVDPSGHLQDWVDKGNAAAASPCSWSGVTCDQELKKVTGLDLTQRNLSGLISDHIQLLKDLDNLNISRNLFTGQLPVAVFNLTRLRTLDISHNNFNGTVPNGIWKLKLLVNFNAFSNNFTGPLPLEFVRLPLLQQLNLAGSYFEGSIPAEYGSFSSNLRFLHLAGNSITGPIPPELGRLQSLRHMEIGYNVYNSGIPWELGNMTALEYLDIAGANLSGSLPPELGRLRRLNSMFLFRNNLSGFIPPQLSNITGLISLDLSDNMLAGPIPESFTGLKELKLLSLMYNNMTGHIPEGMAELPNLEAFLIWNNFFSGSLPEQLGRNSNLRLLDASTNALTGPIPPDLCAGGKLFKLILFSNGFDGEIPSSLAACRPLWRFRIADNALSGRIPAGFGMLPNLTFVDFSMNNFTGGIPSNLCNSPSLQYMNLSYNPLGGSLPSQIWSVPAMQIFSAAFANLSGELPPFTDCSSLQNLELQGNTFSGSIPEDVIHCQKLTSLELSHNQLTGLIPTELASIPDINRIDLSHNALTGTIPTKFTHCTTLDEFNVSFNRLSGPVPSDGIFRHMSASVFAGNQFLCGGFMAPCLNSTYLPSSSSYSSENRKKPGPLVWVMGAGFAICIFIFIVGTHCFYRRYKWQICAESQQNQQEELEELEEYGAWKMVSFSRLGFTVEDVLKSLKPGNIIGGSVYKAYVPGGDIVAVKKLQLNVSRMKQSVSEEMASIVNVQHMNVLRLLGFCYNSENALLLLLSEYMPNGNLAHNLHVKREMKWIVRYRIALGVARGLCHLHHDCNPVVVHRDVKASNILLDGHMEPRLADFGIAKLVQTDEPSTSSVAAGSSNGYIAPEYVSSLHADQKTDIYSFGVVLLELLTGRRPMDSGFGDGISIVEWVRGKTQIQSREGNLMDDILDQNLWSMKDQYQDVMFIMLKVALLCTAKCPADRPSMRDVVGMLSETKPSKKIPSQGSTSAFQALNV